MSEGRTRIVAAGAAVVVALAAFAFVQGADRATVREQPIVPLGPQGIVPQFIARCAYSHAAPDDPIVFPGRPGASHLHQFFGATGVDAHSTASKLRGGDTTCQQRSDSASYWAPALYDDGRVVDPIHLVAYYRPGPDVDPATVQPFPPGLAMIAGDHRSTGAQPLSVVGWHCGSSPALSSDPPTCTDNARLALRVTFPDCWDGENVDSDDHRSHMALSYDGACPDDHPVPVTQLVLDIHYPVSGPARLGLASGTPRSAHADFLNAWDQDALANEVAACINRSLTCGVVSNRATG